MFGVEFPKFPELILQLVNLRYLAVDADIPRSISMLRNLQTLIAHGIDSIAVIADLPQLRHLIVKLMVHCKDRYRCSCDFSRFNLHENLQTLSKVSLRALIKLCGKLPNLRKLEIEGSWRDAEKLDLACFYNLETLKCDFGYPQMFLNSNSLNKLTFSSVGLSQSLLDAIGLIPNLQILILESCYCYCSDWETCEGGFPKLRYLHIKNAECLRNLLATENDFPVLRHLVVESCDDLNEIPIEFGEIETLGIIEVSKCEPSVLASARRILEEQRKLGNDFQLHIDSEFKLDKDHQLSIKSYTFTSQTTLPHFLRNLTLECCRVPKTLLSANDDHPEFQVLNIQYCRYESSTWDPFEGVFFKIQYLIIVESDLKNWLATEIHFPVLRHLVVRYCCHLKEIPNDFWKIKTLEMIEVDGCKHSVFESARRILEEQRHFGNNGLQLLLGRAIDGWSFKEDEKVVEEEESLICKVENHGLTLYNISNKTIFPQSLRKLTLRFCELTQAIFSAIGDLLELQVLKLRNCRFESSTWKPSQYEFIKLVYLEIAESNPENLLAANFPFPALQHLFLYDCPYLIEISSGIGEIHSLKLIEVDECRPSLFDSAKMIFEKRPQHGNNDLELLLKNWTCKHNLWYWLD